MSSPDSTLQEGYHISLQKYRAPPNADNVRAIYYNLHINGEIALSSNPENPYANHGLMARQFNVPISFWKEDSHARWIDIMVILQNIFRHTWNDLTLQNPKVTSVNPLTLSVPADQHKKDQCCLLSLVDSPFHR